MKKVKKIDPIVIVIPEQENKHTCKRHDKHRPHCFTGPTGSDGQIGISGPIGLRGEEGKTGPIGHTGPIGLRGEEGKTGPIGHTGPIGLMGDTGHTGPIGLMGHTGHTGPANILPRTGFSLRQSENFQEIPSTEDYTNITSWSSMETIITWSSFPNDQTFITITDTGLYLTTLEIPLIIDANILDEVDGIDVAVDATILVNYSPVTPSIYRYRLPVNVGSLTLNFPIIINTSLPLYQNDQIAVGFRWISNLSVDAVNVSVGYSRWTLTKITN